MFNQEEIRKVHASQIDSFLRLSQISFGGIERIVRLQLDMSRQSLDDQGKLAGELVKLSNPQDVANHVSKAASASLEQAVNHSRNLYEAVSEIQGEVAKLAEENIGLLNKSMISTIDALAKNAPAGSESAVNAVKSGIAASAAAVNSMTKAAQQVAEFAGTSVKAASTATADAVRNASKKAASQATA